MEYIYASLLLHSLGKEINEENLKKIFEALGVQPDEVVSHSPRLQAHQEAWG